MVCLGQGEGLRSTCEEGVGWQGKEFPGREVSLVKLVSSRRGIWQAWWCWPVSRPVSGRTVELLAGLGLRGDRLAGCGKLGQGACPVERLRVSAGGFRRG